MMRELRREWAAGTPDGTLLARGLFLRLLVHLARRYAESHAPGADSPPAAPGASSAQEATVAAAVRYLDEHFAEPLRVEQVAASVFLSPDRFTEVFARTMGRTPRDYIRHLRVERARFCWRRRACPCPRSASGGLWRGRLFHPRFPRRHRHHPPRVPAA